MLLTCAQALSQNHKAREQAERDASYWAAEAQKMLPEYNKLLALHAENAELKRQIQQEHK